jgi:hypothetical protein
MRPPFFEIKTTREVSQTELFHVLDKDLKTYHLTKTNETNFGHVEEQLF